jgi:hypothetical protein
VVIGGVLVDGGRMDWVASGKFPTLTEPYEGFHGMNFAEESTTSAFLLRARREGLRDFGACMAPMTAFQILQGMETLPLRMARHIANTRRVVEFLSMQKEVERVHHPDEPTHPDHQLAARLYPKGCSAILSFEIKGGRDAGRKFIEALTLFSHLANIGDAKSLVIHPATTTHFRMDDDALKAAGITGGTIRLSIGLEHPDDLARGPGARVEGLTAMNVIAKGYPAYAYTGGKPFDASLPAIVFIHGAAFDHSVWQWQSRYFAHHGFSVLAVDLPGHGRSPGALRESIGDYAEWIAAMLDAVGLPQASLVGHSMGSLIALETALRHGPRVTKLALVGTAAPMPVSDAFIAAAREEPAVGQEWKPCGAIRASRNSHRARFPARRCWPRAGD